MDEHAEAGGVEDVDLRSAPLDDRAAGRNRHLASDFLVVVVSGGRAVIDSAQALGGPSGVQHGRYQGRLAGVSVADHRDITDVCSRIDFQVGLLQAGAGRKRPTNEDGN